jgi:hypothetical protein
VTALEDNSICFILLPEGYCREELWNILQECGNTIYHTQAYKIFRI